ncbi:MAG TPA: glycoside hydrolase family 2 TIM barrel-domain containing protein [Limnochordia bacterium]|nr:glycoside hydrolase family 2 TIM barrel-domain containing protein [Limnochordia bacterium]
MPNHDLFADIGLTEHPAQNEQLAEITPIPLQKYYFTAAEEKADPVKERSYGEKLEEFKAELTALRQKYAPFLENHVPNPPLIRRKVAVEQFQFRYQSEHDHDFTHVLKGWGEWEPVTIPDYRGPAGLDGKWTGYYRTEFEFEKAEGKRAYLVFKGIDYIANVYLNDRWIGSHEGFFAPFEFDITNAVRKHNVLVVEVKNDYPTLGVQEMPLLDGDKIYAATGLGWDDPEVGWHHCPPGAGIYNQVYIEERSGLFVHDMFIRPDIDNHSIEVWIDLFSSDDRIVQDFAVDLEIHPRNFQEQVKLARTIDVPYAGPGINYYRYRFPFDDYRLWEPDSPWLYTARVRISRNGQLLDTADCSFGMRKFHMDEAEEPKGTLYLNNRPIILRGANEMGHLQQCVMRGDFEQLIDDILIAKLANLNYFRITQRPVQEEIYDYCDMLGVMHQCDLPLFGTLRRNQFYEAIRQVGEMERLIRSHPSSIMVTFINEPVAIRKHPNPKHKYNRRYLEKAHRHLFRQELEYFFQAARKAIALENPDRVVKNVEGDYDPPTLEGLPDFHCYCMWYTNHAVPFGKLHKGYLPAVKRGWKVTCGEYGTEGLDNYAVMINHYPRQWLPESTETHWHPDRIVRAQTYLMHGDWYPEQSRIQGWIAASQEHQALAAKLMTDAFRRRSDLLITTAIHLLIDAWPSGWMKALVGVDRIPKPAYFAYQESLEPIRVNLRTDRLRVYGGETLEVESWILNDTTEAVRGRIVVTVRDGAVDYASFAQTCIIGPAMPAYAGSVRFEVPNLPDRSLLYLDAVLLDGEGRKTNQERLTLTVFDREASRAGAAHKKIAYIGTSAEELLRLLGLQAEAYAAAPGFHPEVIVASSVPELNRHRERIFDQISQGTHLLVVRDNDQPLGIELMAQQYSSKSINPVYFAAVNSGAQGMRQFAADDFVYLYNADKDLIDFTADCYIIGEGLEPLLYTYRKKHDPDGKGKFKLPVVATGSSGAGRLTLCSLPLAGKIGFNPTLDRFLLALVQGI